MVDPKLDPDNDILIFDTITALGPAAHASSAARLVGVATSRVQLVVAVRGDVEVVVCELSAAVVERGGRGEHLLEGGSVDLIGNCGAVDGVADSGVGNAEGAVGVGVEVEAGGG